VTARTRTVSFACRGHAAIAGTHAKTIEFTRDTDVTRRATCVLGVASEHDNGALRALRGDIEVTMECGDERDTFTATMTPFFLGDNSLVFRRGRGLRGRTIAYAATKGAAEIDRALVHALTDRGAQLFVTVKELGTGDTRGALFVVAVPIGNDDDLSPRARKVLDTADLVLAEDTRRFRDLATRTGLRPTERVESYHEHNEAARVDRALAALASGARVALVSDAGTPLCSDPGYVVVERAIEAGYHVSPIPGPSSLLAVLSASGLPVDRFTYAGFLARRPAARQAELSDFVEQRATFVCHEAPHRVEALLHDLATVCPDWNICVGREVTKVFEEFARGTAAELQQTLGSEEPRGEYTFVVAPAGAVTEVETDDVLVRLDPVARALLADGVTAKTVAHALAALPGVSRKDAYARVLELQGDT
jgi:16S rRNA (cytidine1402-2'-O)-methyltransferase